MKFQECLNFDVNNLKESFTKHLEPIDGAIYTSLEGVHVIDNRLYTLVKHGDDILYTPFKGVLEAGVKYRCEVFKINHPKLKVKYTTYRMIKL